MKPVIIALLCIIFHSCKSDRQGDNQSSTELPTTPQNITIIINNPLKKQIFFDWSSLLDAATQPYDATAAHDTILIKRNLQQTALYHAPPLKIKLSFRMLK